MDNFKDPFANARILGGDEPGFIPIEPTSHITVLRNTAFQLDIIAGEGIVKGYQMILRDQGENHSYVYRFDDDVRAAMEKIFEEMPRVGEELPTEEDE